MGDSEGVGVGFLSHRASMVEIIGEFARDGGVEETTDDAPSMLISSKVTSSNSKSESSCSSWLI